MKETKSTSNMVKIKFNALCMPKVRYNETIADYEALCNTINSRIELAKLMNEKGDTPEETKELEMARTRSMSLGQQMNYIYNKFDCNIFYYKDDVVELPEIEAKYYLNQYCGGNTIVYKKETLKDGTLKVDKVKTHYKQNIDGQAYFYDKNELGRYEREYKGLKVAEIYNG